MIYIGIDNGVSGSIALIADNGQVHSFGPMPTRSGQDYVQKAKNITRVNVKTLRADLRPWMDQDVRVFIERPMVNPGRFTATGSALRALEATLIAIESLGMPVTAYLDSRGWQKKMLPGIKGSDALKKASCDIGMRKWPRVKDIIKKHKDADALFIAEFARLEKL